MNYVGIDWAYRRAAWCRASEGGWLEGEGLVSTSFEVAARWSSTLRPRSLDQRGLTSNEICSFLLKRRPLGNRKLTRRANL